MSCELSRMSKVIESLTIDGNTLPIRFIRYNPHSYTVDNMKQKTNQTQRHQQLIEKIVNTEFTSQFSVKCMFYDTINGKPAIFNDPEYTDAFKEFVEL